jgi:nucleotide-binding universal stress UspA family protein
MSIVCGTDFSEPSLRAAHAAALLAARSNMRLHLVHAVEMSSEQLFGEQRSGHIDWAEGHLRKTAERLSSLGADVKVHLEFGPPDERLQDVAANVGAKLVVIAALGKRLPGKWQLGSNAYRLAHDARVPVLLVRTLAPFEAWSNGTRPLRILFGADLSLSCEHAMHWIRDLNAVAPCEVTAVHLYFPPEQFHRFGLGGVRSFADPDPEVTKALARNFTTRLAAGLGSTPVVKTRFEPHLGRVGDRLAALALEEQADVVVVGSHGRNGLGRLLHGTVSHEVIERSDVSVVCVPAPRMAAAPAPRINSVLVATDFSPTGDCAVPLAYSAVADGGTVHLVHIVKERLQPVTDPRDIFPTASTDTPEQAAARLKLLELVPGDAAERHTTTQLHSLESNDAAEAICQAAERLDAAVICIGTHGRTGLSKVALGSVAQAVVAGTRRPVLLAHRPID